MWAEKLGLVPKFAGNAATRHGTNQEPIALHRYRLGSAYHCLLWYSCYALLGTFSTARAAIKSAHWLVQSLQSLGKVGAKWRRYQTPCAFP